MNDRTELPSELGARVQAFARAVRTRRKALGLTQIELSRLAGCGPDFVYDVEVGKTTLRLDKLLELLAVLGLELVLTSGKQMLRVGDELGVASARAETDAPVRSAARPSRSAKTKRRKPA